MQLTVADRWTLSHQGKPYRAYDPDMLVGRAREQKRIGELLEHGRRGRSGALLLHGEPGVGKTALLDDARARAKDMMVARVVGVESEATLPFAGLTSLVAPLRDHLGALRPRQRAALEAALALGPPVADDRLAVAAATLALLAAAAEHRPLLVIVDDAHWLDDASREAILFAARRLGDESICLLIASREHGLAADGIPRLAVPPLSERDALELLSARADLAPSVAARIYGATAGNPLALLTVPALLTDAQREGRAPMADPVPAGSAEAAFGHVTAGMPPDTQRALLIAGADGSGRLDPVLRALDHAGLNRQALGPAEDASLITIAGNALTFHHPLVRSAVYHAAEPAQRRRAHAVLAAAYDTEAEADRRAWHLAGAGTGPDERVAAALEAAAERASRRQGYAAAVEALVRAAELDPRARRRRAPVGGRSDPGGTGWVTRSGTGLGRRRAAPPRHRGARRHRRTLRRRRITPRRPGTALAADLALVRGRAIRDRDPATAAAALEAAAAALSGVAPERESALLLEAAVAAERVDRRRAVALAGRAAETARRAGADASLAAAAHAAWVSSPDDRRMVRRPWPSRCRPTQTRRGSRSGSLGPTRSRTPSRSSSSARSSPWPGNGPRSACCRRRC